MVIHVLFTTIHELFIITLRLTAIFALLHTHISGILQLTVLMMTVTQVRSHSSFIEPMASMDMMAADVNSSTKYLTVMEYNDNETTSVTEPYTTQCNMNMTSSKCMSFGCHESLSLNRDQFMVESYISDFNALLEKYDCRQKDIIALDQEFSVVSNCSYCFSAYIRWVCADNSRYIYNGTTIQACSLVCQSVKRSCPYIHPTPSANETGGYTSSPSFMCNDVDYDDLPCFFYKDSLDDLKTLNLANIRPECFGDGSICVLTNFSNKLFLNLAVQTLLWLCIALGI